MRKIFVLTGKRIGEGIDFFYPPFKRYVGRQFFRYGASGALNMLFDWVIYFITYNFILQKQLLHLCFVTLTPHIASLLITFPISFFTGFLLQKYVTFTTSKTRGKEQLLRYMVVVGVNLLINYFGLKLLVEVVRLYPTPSKMVITVVTTTFSYISQKRFTFKMKHVPEQE